MNSIKLMFLVSVIVFTMTLFIVACSSENEVAVSQTSDSPDMAVSLPDHAFEEVIRKAIGKESGNIYVSDLKQLRVLNANRPSIKDITGIQHCTAYFGVNRTASRTNPVTLSEHSGQRLGPFRSPCRRNPVSEEEQ